MGGSNLYGDDLSRVNSGHGVDVASQRLDDLDKAAIELIEALVLAGAKSVAVADYGCGRGGWAKAAAESTNVALVDAIDQEDFAREFSGTAVSFRQADLARDLAGRREQYDCILCQRTIHYLRWPDALNVCRLFNQALRKGGWLFISASGLGSELGDGYPAAARRPEERFAKLSEENQRKHGIKQPVCLYTVDELAELLMLSEFQIDEAWASAFGNIKIIARKS